MEKSITSNKSFQTQLPEKEDSENNNYEIIYSPEDHECRVYCDICDNLCIERFQKNLFKSQTHNINIRNREQLK